MAYFFHNWYVNRVIESEIIERVEDKSAQVIASFWLSLKDINLLIDDWADWDSMAEAINNWSLKFSEDNFPQSLIEDNNLFYLAVINKKMENIHILKSKKYDKFNFKNLNLRIKELIKNKKSKIVQTLICLEDKSFYIYAQPIEFQSRKKEIRGYLVGVREIDSFFQNKMAEVLQNDNVEIMSIKDLEFGKLKFRNNQCFVENTDKSNEFYIYSLIHGKKLEESIVVKTKMEINILKNLNKMNLYFLVLALLSFGIVLYIFLITYRNYRKKLDTILKVSSKLSKKLDNEFHYNNNEDVLSQLELILNTLFLNIDKLEIERKTRVQREMVKEKVFAVGRIAAELSHEINTPIRIIKNCMPTIEKKAKIGRLDEKDFKMLQLVENEVENIDKITKNLLSFLRNDYGKMELLNLNQLINNAIRRVEKSKNNSIKFFMNFEKTIFIHGVFEQLSRVFINLFNNAIDANASKIEIKNKEKDDLCYIYVNDNGKGVPNEIKNTLFEPFVTIKQKRGLGLGLNISYNIISNHGGELFLEDCEEFSTCFVVKLPFVEIEPKDK